MSVYKFYFQEEVDAAVAELLKLKADYKNLTGEDLAGGSGKGKKDKKKDAGNKNEKQDSKPAKKQEKSAPAAKGVENGDIDSTGKKITRYGGWTPVEKHSEKGVFINFWP